MVATKHEIEVGRKYVIDIKHVVVMFNVVGDILDKEIDDAGLRERISLQLGRVMLPMASE